jgi:Xaa-Pro aminopeptidase
MKTDTPSVDLSGIKKKRFANLSAKMKEAKLDVIFCTSLRSLAYVGRIYQNLAWFVNTAVVYPASGDPFLIVPLGDRERVEKETWIPRVVAWNPALVGIQERKFEDVIMDYIRENKLERGNLGIEGNLSWPLYRLLTETFPQAKLVRVDYMMEECMIFKDDYEIGLMRKVAQICTIGFEAARDNVKPGMTENELAGHMEIAMRRAGCTGYWVPNQVGTGERVLLDHYPSDAAIQANHFVKVGCHGSYQLYCGDLCNVMALKKAEPDYVRMTKVVEEASRKTIDAIRPGVKSSQLFSILANYISDKGYPKACNWYAGHGLGTGHQRPFISPDDHTELKERMILVLQPLAQPIDGSNSYINEVMLLVTSDGVELISNNPIGLTQL